MDPVEGPDTAVEQEWDADGFEIPSLKAHRQESRTEEVSEVKKASIPREKAQTEIIYLGPHGAPPSQVKQHELHTRGKKSRPKQKIKEADRKGILAGRENKVDLLRVVMESKGSVASPKGTRERFGPNHQVNQFRQFP